jgi:hypothetical protein
VLVNVTVISFVELAKAPLNELPLMS